MEDPRRYMRAMEYIRTRIENGTFKPHELLPSIGDLAGQTGHSRHTVSKALRLLQDEGFVARTPGLGYVAKVRATTTGALRPVPAAGGHTASAHTGGGHTASAHTGGAHTGGGHTGGGHNGSPAGWGQGGAGHGRH